MFSTVEKFLPAISRLPSDRPLKREDLITNDFFMEKEGDLEMYYAPHNEYINRDARIVIAGITPGWSQMKTAYEQFVKSIAAGESLEASLFATKKASGFAGSMRTNLVRMLDGCGLPEALKIADAHQLFEDSRTFLHTSSVIKYPVFTKGKNYSGHQPAIKRSNLLQQYTDKVFPGELAEVTAPALIIPLGKAVEEVVLRLAEEDKLQGHTFLTGFPHPSGVNAHRERQFQQEKNRLREQVSEWNC